MTEPMGPEGRAIFNGIVPVGPEGNETDVGPIFAVWSEYSSNFFYSEFSALGEQDPSIECFAKLHSLRLRYREKSQVFGKSSL